MNQPEATPFFDERGNLIIPQQLLHQQPSGRVLVADEHGHPLYILLSLRKPSAQREIHTETPSATVNETGADTHDILLALAQSSMDFWDNPVDDAVWNNA